MIRVSPERCERCEARLVRTGVQLLTDPPQIKVHCVRCGWSGVEKTVVDEVVEMKLRDFDD